VSDDLPLGVVLAGGIGRRIGGNKPMVELDGRPMLHYPLAVLHAVLGHVVVMCKEHTPLPDLGGMAPIWCEPELEFHPLIGVMAALRSAGRPILVCGADMPLVTPEVVDAIVRAPASGEAKAVIPRAAGRLQPLLALYRPEALPALEGMDPAEPATDVVERLDPHVLDLDDDDAFFNVNAPEDVLTASALRLSRT
jgi:molybdopterin-guanine dinucleotide biosynthesis protein A